MIRTMDDAVKFLERYIPDPDRKFPGQLGLDRMMYLCELMGNPQLKYKTIHVGGTSGKGSTATIIASILATKYKVGLHTSPHLVRLNERIKVLHKFKNQISKIKATTQNLKLNISDKDISDHELITLVNHLQSITNKMESSRWGIPSYFEIVTAMAFVYFAKQKVDYAVIEVGMGGRFDGTNVIKPLVAVLTNVGLDHTEILGKTVEEIAKDKAGIIKSGIDVVTGAKQKSVIKIIKSKVKTPAFAKASAGKQKSKISLLGEDFKYKIRKIDSSGSVFDYFGENTYRDLKISLLGRHQVENAVVAIRAIEKLSTTNYQLPTGKIRDGLKSVFIPGRLEIVGKKPLIILDGAHNPDKIKALAQAIKTIFPRKKVISIVAIKNDKKAEEIVQKVLSISDKVIFTQYRLTTDLGKTYSYKATELRQMVKQADFDKVMVEKKAMLALKVALEKAKEQDLILITGSLYLVGELRNSYEDFFHAIRKCYSHEV